MKPGDIVQLKSGSPLMTVLAINQGGVVCTWFNNNDNKAATFPESALEKYEEGDASGFIG